ncbi:hypothetical protein N9N67_01265 [Bacteriovoracaceae bacterium]|nr:hypothetical protein [Bacteriovoracaceae bacterium]
MSFSYDKIKKKQESDDKWASYSDLFMVLSFVFLLLYVVSSLRSGSIGITKIIEQKKSKKEVQELRQQIKVYETLKDDYMAKQASKSEVDNYEELMDRLTLLEDENQKEANKLRNQAEDNKKKAVALNKYQQMVKSIINTNMLQKSRLVHRSKVIKKKNDTIDENVRHIAEQDETIQTQSDEIQKQVRIIAENRDVISQNENKIEELNTAIEKKNKSIAANKSVINKISTRLDKNIKKLQKERRQKKISKRLYNKKLKELQKKSKKSIAKLKRKNKKYHQQIKSTENNLEKANSIIVQANNEIVEQKLKKAELEKDLAQTQSSLMAKQSELNDTQQNLNETQQNLDQTQQKLADTNEELMSASERLNQKMQELESKKQQMQEQENEFQAQLAQQKQDNQDKLDAEKEKFEDDLKKQKITAKAKIKKLAEFNRKMKDKESQFKEKLKNKENQFKRTLASVEKDLKKAQNKANARKRLSQKIAKNLQKAGINANVDGGTGDVYISFEKDYFDNGSANLKNGMEKVLKKFMPLYADTLFKDKDIADKIEGIDIIGFASPTYQGRYVDPHSLDPKDQRAANYNLDLSYKRAKSIKEYIFDTRKLEYKNQKKLLSLVNVTGRGFFSENSKDKAKAKGMSRNQFCREFDCKKAQKVIIKFDLGE